MNRHIDAWLILIVIALITGGLLMVLSASAVMSAETPGAEFKYLYRQLIALGIGSIFCVATALTPIRKIRQNHMLFYCLVGIGLLLCFAPVIGTEVKGARRWIGFGSINFQPSAFAKIVILISLAHFLHIWRGQLDDIRVVLRALAIPAPLMGLILFEPDFGTTLIIASLIVFMMFIAGLKRQYLFGALGGAIVLGIPILLMEEYRLQRMKHFLDPWSAYHREGYQIIQSWIAMHNGGLTGQGLGNSFSKRHFLPEPWTDFIAAVIAEELGFIAVIVVLFLFCALLWRGFHIARRARDAFSMFLAASLTMMICAEAIFNLGVVMGLVPPKGLVLPFISYGSSAMMANLWAIGLLLSISSEHRDVPVDKGWKAAEEM